MKKNFKPIVKSKTRVKSMLEVVEENDSILSENNGPVILQRSRDNATISENLRQSDNEQTNEVQQSDIVEIGSKVYDGKPEKKENLTFKLWWKSFCTKTADGWNTFIHKKGAMRLVALMVVMAMVIITVVIYTSVIRTNMKDLCIDNVKAFVMDENESSGVASQKDLSLKSFTKEKPTKYNTYAFRYIDLFGKNINKSKNIEKFSFGVYTDFEDLTLEININIKHGDSEYTLKNPKVQQLKQRIAVNIRFDYIGAIQFNFNTLIHITFDLYKTSDYIKTPIVKTPINTKFSVFDMKYA